MRFPFILQQKSCNTLLARIGALGKESINLSAVADMTRLDSDRRHSPRLVGAKLAHQKAYRLRVVDPKVRRYARCRHFLFSFPFKGIAPQKKTLCILPNPLPNYNRSDSWEMMGKGRETPKTTYRNALQPLSMRVRRIPSLKKWVDSRKPVGHVAPNAPPVCAWSMRMVPCNRIGNYARTMV